MLVEESLKVRLHQIDAVDDRVHGAVGPAIPTVGTSDADTRVAILHVLDPAHKIIGVVCATVHSFGSDCDPVEGVAVLGRVRSTDCCLFFLVCAAVRPCTNNR